MRLTSTRVYTRPTPVPKMPSGLVELIEGLARDVLRNNPSNVYEFCANHMENLLEIRDGSSTKKSLSLDQKILKAQEKVRQRARDRQEKFDQEIKLLSKDSNEKTTSHDKGGTPLILDPLHVPSLKAPVHHEHDLEHASEVEISHISASLSEVSGVPNAAEIDKDGNKDIPENVMETHTVDNDTTTDTKPEIESIFGNDENEVVNVESLKELAILDIVVQNQTGESHLQTITEVSDENSVSESVSILPKITIGDEHHVPALENISEESRQEIKLDTIIDVGIVNSNKNIIKTQEMQNQSDDMIQNITENLFQSKPEDFPQSESEDLVHNKSTDSVDSNILAMPANNNTGNESLNVKSSVLNVENIASDDFVTENLEEKLISKSNSTEEISTVEKQSNNSVTGGITEINNVSITKNSNNDTNTQTTVQQVVDSSDSSKASADAVLKHYNDKTNSTVSEIADETNVGKMHENALNNEGSPQEIKQDEIQNTNTLSENNLLLENEASEGKSAIELKTNNAIEVQKTTMNVSEIQKVESNKMMPEPEVTIISDKVQLKETPSEGNLDMDKHDGNSTDVSIHKSNSTENTNEDSISIVESDLSKTDDDSMQNNPNNMDLETAAVTIQKVFRSFMFKSRNSTFEDATNDEQHSIDEDNDNKEEYYAAANLNKERRPLGITRMDTVLQTVNEEKSLSLSTDDSSTLSSAATTIQAHVRGFLVRNRLNSSKTFSMNSLVNSHELDNDTDQQKNKTVLNIHIVPEEGNYLSRDESLITSMDLSLDGSPPSSVNLHPLSQDISERRKMLKREDAIQSVSPPSNNSGKLSEESVKEVLINEDQALEREPTDEKINEIEDHSEEFNVEASGFISSASSVTPTTIITISKSEEPLSSPREYAVTDLQRNGKSFTKMSSDESDVVTPFVPSPRSSDSATKLVHSGEFHDVVLPTKVSRSDTSVVRGE